MRILAVDKNNDIFVATDGRLAMRTELQALMQACEHAMQSLLGEMPFSTGRGLPYQETAWGPNPNLRAFEEAARKTLGRMNGVKTVTAFSCAITDNTLSYWAEISSVYGMFNIGREQRNG